jgi:hypothetical protein
MRLRRLLTLIGVAVVLLVIAAPPASAHTLSGPRPTNFDSSVESVTPPAEGVTVSVVDLGNKMELTNTTSDDVVVLGYDNEPFLEVGPDGVFENSHSATTYISRSLKGGVIPPGVDTRPSLEPEWVKRDDGHTARWHFHGTHWMRNELPQEVQQNPGRSQRVQDASFTFEQNGIKHEVAVALDWVPGPSSFPWFLLTGALFAGALIVALRPQWMRGLSLLVGALVAVDVAHAVAYEMGRTGRNPLVEFLTGNFVAIAVWIAAVPTCVGLWRRRSEALYGAVLVGLMIALVGGATDLASFWKSQLPAAGPAALSRWEVAFLLGAGAGVAVGALIQVIRTGRPGRERAEPESGQWLSMLVVGLSDKELRRIAADLDVDEILGAALADLAGRLDAAPGVFAGGALVIDVVADDGAGRHTWSIGAPDASRVVAERVEPAALTIGATFPRLLQLLAGTVALDAAVAAGHVTTDGNAALVATITPYFSERAATADRAPAS